MIRYALKCDRQHEFESWFASADAFDTLAGRGQVVCPDCGSARTEKALMAPRVGQSAARPVRPSLEKLKAEVERNADWVGRDFAVEARRIHDGSAPERAIYGEARLDEARRLVEDGIPVAPLPFVPQRKTN
ncbi:DUF1178 family protein [Roseitranquillus sediminis]|uniref:DUF1178 family protein n=1 Tax=Roseitranquillus sediminis TaxID=2809051 RepID=UPI001D0C573F|nr:DUF1178 family protein [Roseitranquillus sediminis]MBM9594211.1 DUF1178 family protein [Roseitranquillus sediminis]